LPLIGALFSSIHSVIKGSILSSKFKWAFAYLASVFVFSVLYLGYWSYKPDSFIVNQDLNIQPFQEMNQFLWGDGDKYKIGSSDSLSEFKRSYDNEYNKINGVLSKLDELDKEKIELSVTSKLVSSKMSDEIDTNFAAYEKNKLEPFLLVELDIKVKVANLEALIPKVINTKADVEKIKALGAAKVELAGAKVKTAHQALENSYKVLDNSLSFTSRESIKELNRIHKLESEHYEEWLRLEKVLGDLRVKAINSINEHQRLIRDKVNWFDFWFYSVGISTTTTFGDLVPNNRTVKGLVSLQLLLCIFLLGGFVNAVLKS
jgi:hypothetical protein